MHETQELLPGEIRDAARRLPAGADLQVFARRQRRARQRLALLRKFYGDAPCRMARVHLLTSSTVAINRFCAHSAEFNELGEAIMPVDDMGRPRTDSWQRYQDACREQRPMPVRDELWLEAHARDWRTLKESGLDTAFLKAAEQHSDDPNWRLMRRYGELTFGSRVFDHLSDVGRLPSESTIALAMGLAMRRIIGRGWPVAWRVFIEIARAMLWGIERPPDGLPSNRRIAWWTVTSAFRTWGVWPVYRRGLRIQNRGVCCPEVDWPILETLLGPDVDRIHPLIVKFYRNPGRFHAEASLEIRTLPLMFYSRMAALLLGQGLYEEGSGTFPARLRVFRRDDGSMHFVRELYCGRSLRVFDSDFVLRSGERETQFVEVFGDLRIDVVLDAEVRPDGGVAVVGRDIYWRSIRLPRTALRIDFSSRVEVAPSGQERIRVVGTLDIAPRTRLGRFLMHSVLRRPRRLGQITYLLWSKNESAAAPPRPLPSSDSR
ncbi:MAG: hypothetical protein IT428_15280 [Planctomycetaceae bacterium]|nr:hypothetical protein [Planctomycetaceae bacterium]